MIPGQFVFATDEELTRARRRTSDPAWAPATEAIRKRADALADAPPPAHAFDSAWYDADPDRDYGQTYDSFARYGWPARVMGQEIATLLPAAAALAERRYADAALVRASHMVEHLKFHVSHHDAGLMYSIALNGIVDVYFAFRDDFDAPTDRRWREQIAAAGEAICRSREHWRANLAPMPYNNHLAAHQSGLLAAGLALERDEWIDLALDGRGSIGHLLPGCTTDDGLCYESSTHYHFATLGGLIGVAERARHFPRIGRDLYRETFANGVGLKDMFDAPLHLLLPNGELPALGDCYADRKSMWSRCDIYELAYAVYGDPRYAWLISRAGPRRGRNALLFGVETLADRRAPAVRSRVWLEHGYALLTNAEPESYWSPREHTVAAVLTGDLSGVHHHLDSLSLQVFAGGRLWTEDVESEARAVNGFSDPIQKAFNRTAWAHNTVIVDETDQAPIDRPVRVTMFKDLPACRTVQMADTDGQLYPGVAMARSVAVTDDYCLDVFEASADAERMFDWLVHPRADGPATLDLPMRPFEFGDATGYAVLGDATAADVDAAGVTLIWRQDGDAFRADVSAAAPGLLIRSSWPTVCDGSGTDREIFFYRVRAERVQFAALYQLDRPDRRWRVESCRRAFDGLDHRIYVTVTDGRGKREHIVASV